MKKISLLLTALFALFAGTAFGQVTVSDSDDFNVSATILAEPVSIAEETGLDFGQVQQGGTETIAYDSTAAGVMLITGTIGAEVYIQYPTTISLSGDGVDLEVDVSAGTHTTVATSASAYVSEDPISLADISGTGTMRLFIGGVLQDVGGGNIPNTASGVYSGTATITAQYNSF
ncbi:MAG: hypothetical protein WEA56_12020 [Balneolaceae bacterium]